MAKVYGSAAGGAINQAMNTAVARLAPPEPEREYRFERYNPNAITPTSNGWVGVCTFGGLAALSYSDDFPLAMTVFLGVAALAVYVLSTIGHRHDTKRVPIDFAETHPEYVQQLEAVKKHVRDDFQKVVDTGKTTGTVFDGEAQSWAIGAAGELRTSLLIKDGLDDSYSLFDDLELNKNGSVTANVDHLVNGPRGSTMVDTKVWNQKLEFVQTELGVVIPKSCYASDAVSTCIYEASMLPGTVRAIVFAVRGRAASQLKEPVQVGLYYERFDDSNNAKVCPMPVLFVEQAVIAPTIAALDNRLPAAAPIDVSAFQTTGHSAAQ